jgi:hypothetical protein
MSATSSPVHTSALGTDDSSLNNLIRSAKLAKPTAPAQSTIQHKPAKKTRNRIPPTKRIRVMQRYASGENQTAIARQEEINRETVGRIVKSAEMEAFTEEMRERWRGLCDAAIESVSRLIAKDDRPTVLRVLESNKIIAPQGQVQNLSVNLAPKPSGDERVKELMGAFAAVAIERARVYKTPFPEVQEVADKIGVKLGFQLNRASDDAAEEEDNEI